MTPSLLLDPPVRPDFGAEEPRVRSVPGTGAWSAVDDVLAICEQAIHLGGPLRLMPWQVSLLTDILTVRPDGRWAARDAGYLVARQNGKGGVLHALALAGLFLFDDVREILHSAHEVKTAKKAYRELKELIKNTPYLYAKVERRGARVVGFRQSNEDTSITLQDKPGDPDSPTSVIRFIARATNTGRGFSPQWLIIDEAQICTEESREAIFYSTRAQANPLRVWCGTAPKPTDPSDVFTALRDRGRAGGDEHMMWCEWSVDPEVNISDLRGDDAAVAAANPALGFLVDWETIDSERAAAISDAAWEGYCRETLSWWPSADDMPLPWAMVPKEAWDARKSKETPEQAAQPGWLTGPVALAVELTDPKSGAVGTIAAAGACREGGIGGDIMARSPGQSWIVPHVVALTQDPDRPVSKVVIDPRGPAGALIPDFIAAGVTITECPTPELLKATGAWIASCNEGGFVHRDTPELNESVGAAQLRKYGESLLIDRWADGDPTPAIAVDLARWGLLIPDPKPKHTGIVRGIR